MSQYQPMYDSFQRTPRDRYVPAPRINVASNVFLPASELDPYTGQLKPDHERRRRTQGKHLEYEELVRKAKETRESLEREIKKGGVRVTDLTAFVLCFALAIVCLFTIGLQHSRISDIQMQLNTLEEDLDNGTALHEALSAELEAARDISQIGSYAARNLGMIRADAVEAVHLTAVDTRPLDNKYVQPSVQTIEASAQIQTTQVPTVASAGN